VAPGEAVDEYKTTIYYEHKLSVPNVSMGDAVIQQNPTQVATPMVSYLDYRLLCPCYTAMLAPNVDLEVDFR
jgi:hypothetical protein